MNTIFPTELASKKAWYISSVISWSSRYALIIVINSWGLSPRLLGRTLKELAALKSQGDGTYEAQLQLRQLNVLLVVV